MAELLTLDDWFKRRETSEETETVRRTASLAAELGTDLQDTERSTWTVDGQYGSKVAEIRRIPGATLALTAEVQRVVDRHAVGGTVTTDTDELRIDVDITLGTDGLNRG